jgi:small ligand-binding sensory domain FIST
MSAFSLPDWLRRRFDGDQAWCRTALACEPSLEGCAAALSQQLAAAGPADLALVFVSASFASDLPRLLPLLRQRLRATHWLGCLAGGVIGTVPGQPPREVEQQPAISLTLLHLPGARLQPFAIDPGPLPDLDGPAEPWRRLLDAEDDTETPSLLLLIDPGFNAINDLIAGLDYAWPQAAKLGGIAGPHSAPHGSLLLGDQVRSGAIGCLIDGSWGLDPVVAQGCRPIGPVFEVEQAERNVVLELSRGGRRNTPVAALQAILTELSPAERELVKQSLFLGVGHSTFRLDREGSTDPPPFLVRNLMGVDPRNGAVAVAERMRVGQQVQFQLRDGQASRQELAGLLERQRQRQPAPLAGLLFACLGRGAGLYGQPDGDVSLCREPFPDLPIAGAFCNGEVGPVAGTTHLHGYTASWAFLVPRPPAGAQD